MNDFTPFWSWRFWDNFVDKYYAKHKKHLHGHLLLRKDLATHANGTGIKLYDVQRLLF